MEDFRNVVKVAPSPGFDPPSTNAKAKSETSKAARPQQDPHGQGGDRFSLPSVCGSVLLYDNDYPPSPKYSQLALCPSFRPPFFCSKKKKISTHNLYPWLGKCGRRTPDAGWTPDTKIGENTRTPALGERKDRTSPKVRTHNLRLEGFDKRQAQPCGNNLVCIRY